MQSGSQDQVYEIGGAEKLCKGDPESETAGMDCISILNRELVLFSVSKVPEKSMARNSWARKGKFP
jgi:hypothetical protein